MLLNVIVRWNSELWSTFLFLRHIVQKCETCENENIRIMRTLGVPPELTKIM